MDMEQIETEVMTPWGATTVKTFREAAGLDQNRQRDELNAWGSAQDLGQSAPMTYGTGIGAKQAALGSQWKYRERMEAEAVKPLEFNKIPSWMGFDLDAKATEEQKARLDAILEEVRRRDAEMDIVMTVKFGPEVWATWHGGEASSAKEPDHNAAMIERDGPPAPRKAEPVPAIEPVSAVKPALHFPVAEMGHKFGGWGA